MPPRTSRRVAVLAAGVGFIALLSVIDFGGSDSHDATGGATTSPTTTTATTVPRTTTTRAPTTTRGTEHMGLPEALEAGLVEVEFRSTGGASGDIVELSIRLKDAIDTVLNLSVPTGMMLSNPAAGEQDLVIRGLEGLMTGESTYQPVDEIELPDLDWREYLVEAFCAEAHDDNPTEGGELTPSGLGSEDLVKALGAIDAAGAGGDILVMQAVVWVITDDVSLSDLEAVGYGLDEAGVALARQVIVAAGLEPADYRLFAG